MLIKKKKTTTTKCYRRSSIIENAIWECISAQNTKNNCRRWNALYWCDQRRWCQMMPLRMRVFFLFFFCFYLVFLFLFAFSVITTITIACLSPWFILCFSLKASIRLISLIVHNFIIKMSDAKLKEQMCTINEQYR